MKDSTNDSRFKNMGRRFTDQEDDIIKKAIKENKTVKDTAYRLRRKESSVQKRAKIIAQGTFTR